MIAETVRVSYAPAHHRVADALDADAYRSYLRRARRGRVEVGAEWSEFVGRGCGATGEVSLRVESVAAGSSIGAETTFVFEPRVGPDAARSLR